MEMSDARFYVLETQVDNLSKAFLKEQNRTSELEKKIEDLILVVSRFQPNAKSPSPYDLAAMKRKK